MDAGEGQGGLIYRRARVADRPAVLEVLRCANFHRVPSPEVPSLDLDRFLVAELDGRVVGAAGWALLPDGRGKTTLMAVAPDCRGLGIGERLQSMRMLELRELGCRTVVTNADRARTIAWYERKFGYRRVGRVRKLHPFGALDVDHWTTLEADIERWYQSLP